MQNLIEGERYRIKHRNGHWGGEATFDGWDRDLMKVRDIEVLEGPVWIKAYYLDKAGRTKLGGTPEKWGFELVNFSLENE